MAEKALSPDLQPGTASTGAKSAQKEMLSRDKGPCQQRGKGSPEEWEGQLERAVPWHSRVGRSIRPHGEVHAELPRLGGGFTTGHASVSGMYGQRVSDYTAIPRPFRLLCIVGPEPDRGLGSSCELA